MYLLNEIIDESRPNGEANVKQSKLSAYLVETQPDVPAVQNTSFSQWDKTRQISLKDKNHPH